MLGIIKKLKLYLHSKYILLACCLLLFADQVFSAHNFAVNNNQKSGVGEVAANVFVLSLNIREIIQTICIIAGCILCTFSLVQYQKHRNNPIEVSLGSVIFTLITGASLIGLSFIPIQLN